MRETEGRGKEREEEREIFHNVQQFLEEKVERLMRT